MAEAKDLQKWQAGLQSTFPLLGVRKRRKAMDALVVNRDDPEVVSLLVQALESQDEAIAARAAEALATLTSPAAVDVLCAIWAKDRDARLGRIMAKQRYVAKTPARLRALSGLQAGALNLLEQADGELVAEIIGALADTDGRIRNSALRTLEGLKNQEGVDALCAIWAKNRDMNLGQIVVQQGYTAKKPLSLNILTYLKCDNEVPLDTTEAIPILLGLLQDPDEIVITGATRTLEMISPGPLQDDLCEEAIKDPAGAAAIICIRTGKRPSDHERACLYLFVTRQLDAYFQEDFEFQNLRLHYDRSNEAVRAQVMEVVRSGDRRCAGFFGTRSKPLRQCSEVEIKLALDSWIRHREWSRLFQACMELPMKYSLRLLAPLGQSGWRPESPELKSVFRRILADGGDPSALPATKKPAAESSLIEKWLAQGRDGELAGLSAAELVKRLKTATPPEGVCITAALATKGEADTAIIETVKNSPHWLIRLAGYLTGISLPDLQHDSVQDSNYWVTELVSAKGILDIWPGESTPADLEALSAAPPEAWAGKLGSGRKVLRTIMTHRITTGTFEPMVVEAAEFAGEFVEASEIEFGTGSGA